MLSYEARVSRELESYREERPELGLPPIFTYWAVRHLSPGLLKVMEVQTIPEFFAKYMIGCLQRTGSRHVAEHRMRGLRNGNRDCQIFSGARCKRL